MKKYFKKTTVAISVTAILALSTVGYLFIHTINQSKQETAEKPKSSELDEFMQKDNEYQKKITQFNPDNYQIVKANPSISNEQGSCVNGFGGDLPKIGKGMLTETLYNLDAEKIETNFSDEFAYSPYVIGYSLVGDILFMKPYDFFDRKLLSMAELTRNFSDTRLIVGTKEYKNSYATMESKFGFPQFYVAQQAGNVISTSAFNNGCSKNVAITNIKFKKIDLEGEPISSILSASYQTNLYNGFNGLYNHTIKSANFVSKNFLEWAQSNNRIYQYILHNPQAVFPKGSIIYIPTSFETFDESVSVNFSQQPIDLTLEQIQKELSVNLGRPVQSIEFIEEKLPEYTLYKAVDKSTYEPLNGFAVAKKGGKFYVASWQLPSNRTIDGTELDRANLVLMNQKAMGAVVSLFKSTYQGEAIDIGTPNQNLDQKFNKAISQSEQMELQSKKDQLLNGQAKTATVDDIYNQNTIPLKDKKD